MRFHKIENSGAVLVIGLEPHSPAKAAGMREGDAILTINGQTINDVDDLQRALYDAVPDRPTKITAIRHTDIMEFECYAESR